MLFGKEIYSIKRYITFRNCIKILVSSLPLELSFPKQRRNFKVFGPMGWYSLIVTASLISLQHTEKSIYYISS